MSKEKNLSVEELEAVIDSYYSDRLAELIQLLSNQEQNDPKKKAFVQAEIGRTYNNIPYYNRGMEKEEKIDCFIQAQKHLQVALDIEASKNEETLYKYAYTACSLAELEVDAKENYEHTRDFLLQALAINPEYQSAKQYARRIYLYATPEEHKEIFRSHKKWMEVAGEIAKIDFSHEHIEGFRTINIFNPTITSEYIQKVLDHLDKNVTRLAFENETDRSPDYDLDWTVGEDISLKGVVIPKRITYLSFKGKKFKDFDTLLEESNVSNLYIGTWKKENKKIVSLSDDIFQRFSVWKHIKHILKTHCWTCCF